MTGQKLGNYLSIPGESIGSML